MSNENRQKTIQPTTHDGENISQDLKITISVVIPTYNSSESIEWTLDSLVVQKQVQCEIILIDAGSEDHTLDIVQEYGSAISRIYSVAEYNLCDMCNRGITLASGEYLTFLFPGSRYNFDQAFALLSSIAKKEGDPDLIHFGILLFGNRSSNFSFENGLYAHLKQAPEIRLESCLFKLDLFEKIGKFNPKFSQKFTYEFLTRCFQKGSFLVGYERFLLITNRAVRTFGLRTLYETWSILRKTFGLIPAFKWLLGVNLIRLFLFFVKKSFKSS